MSSPIVVGIAGASGSGKSQFAEKLMQRLIQAGLNDQVALIQQDSYYRDQSTMQFSEREKTNYDHPEAFEHQLLVKQLKSFRAGRSIDVPQYDYSQHNRKPEATVLQSCPVLIVEGILLFHDAAVRDLIDIKIFVDLPLETCLQRRIHRDTTERGRTQQSVRDQFDQTVKPMFQQYLYPTRDHADFTIAGQGDQSVPLNLLSTFLKQSMPD